MGLNDTTLATGLRAKQWDEKFFAEYVRANRFARFMGSTENAVIHTKQNLTKAKGDTIVFALVNELTAAGNDGTIPLEGNEEPLDTRSHAITMNVLRHGVVMSELEEQKSPFGLREAAKERLKHWAMKRMRNDIIDALGSIDGTPYATATLTGKNTWLTNNADRVLFGASGANRVAGDHAASLLNIDNTADKLTPDTVSLAKHMAQVADGAIRPITVNNDEEWFVMFCHSRAFRDLRSHAAMQQANREAWNRGEKNPLFSGGDLIWDGVIIKEIPEIPVILGAGAAGIDVAPNYLCGAQAVGIGWAQRTKTVTQESDYKFQHGVAVQEIRGIEKLRFGTGATDTAAPKDHGVVTVYTAGVAL